jgi:hypothetical protein
MSNLFQTQFGQDAQNFVDDETSELRVRALIEEVKNGEVVKDTIDAAFQDAQHAASYEEAQRALHNMDVIGVERLLQMRFTRSHGVATESVAGGAVVAIGGALLLLIGLLGKYFGWISFFSSSQGRDAETARAKAKEEILILKDKMRAKLDAMSKSNNPDMVNEVKEWIKYLERTVGNHTRSLLSKRVLETPIDYDVPNGIREGIIESNRATKQLLKGAEDAMSDMIKIADRYGHADAAAVDQEIAVFKESILRFFSDQEKVVESVLFSKGLGSAKRLMSEDVRNMVSTDYSRGSLMEAGRKAAEVVRRGKTTLTALDNRPITVEDLAGGKVIGTDSVSLKTMSHIGDKLKDQGKELDAEIQRLEGLAVKFKDMLQRKEALTGDGGMSLKSAANEVHKLVETISLIYRPNVELAGLAAVTATTVTEVSIAQMKAIEIDWFKKEAARLGVY